MPFRRPGSPYWHFDRTITVAGQRHRVRGSTGVRGSKRRNGPAPARLTVDEAIGTYCAQVASHQPSCFSARCTSVGSDTLPQRPHTALRIWTT